MLLLLSKVRETYSKFPYLRFVVLELNDDLYNVLQWESTSCVPRLRNLYQLRPKVSASSVSVASQGVNVTHDELHPAVKKFVSVASHGVCFMLISCVANREPDAYELHSKVRWVRNMSNSLKVLTQFYCTLLYTQLHTHIQNC